MDSCPVQLNGLPLWLHLRVTRITVTDKIYTRMLGYRVLDFVGSALQAYVVYAAGFTGLFTPLPSPPTDPVPFTTVDSTVTQRSLNANSPMPFRTRQPYRRHFKRAFAGVTRSPERLVPGGFHFGLDPHLTLTVLTVGLYVIG